MDMYKKMFKIGEAAEIANISKKQLRHYDELGIFSPSYKDPFTGYRYYTEEQLRDIFTIRDLRFLGMSLQEIGDTLTNCKDMNAVAYKLEKHQLKKRKEIESSLYELAQTVSYLSRFREAMLCMQDKEIRTVHVPSFSAICETIQWNAPKHGYKTRSWLLSDLIQKARKQYLDTRENFILLRGEYMNQFQSEEDALPVESTIGWVVQESAVPMPLTKIPGFDAITITSIGTDPDKKERYEKLIAYAKEHHLELDNYALERHILGSSMGRSYDKRIMRIYLAIKH